MKHFTLRPWVCALLAAASVAAVGCEDESDRATDVDTLRLLAVRAETPFAKSGSQVPMEALVFDGSPHAVRPDGTKRPVEVLWLGGCVNPPGDDFRTCNPYLYELLATLGDSGLASHQVPAGAPAGVVGWGTTFTAVVPQNAISSRPQAPDVVHPYSVQFVFTIACAGEIVRLPGADPTKQFPLGCRDPGTGVMLGRDDFEFGYFPLYVYDDIENHAPDLQEISVDGKVDGAACSATNPCPANMHCGTAGVCLVVVPRCGESDADDCNSHPVAIKLGNPVSEPDVTARIPADQAAMETVWVSYYANAGSFDKGSRIIYDSNSGWGEEFHGAWRSNVASGTEARLWAVVHDSRNGVSWRWQDVWVE
ncbi:MAG: hypothetical protein HY898_16950 [Deltaproteobacteria bacterium]|nr:hypothetical protein [Deltaproteobacteria bacterium]